MANNQKTMVNSISIKKFRGLEDVDISFAPNITLIAGKNGTSKSTILGIIAQVFSFSTNYKTKESLSSYRQLGGNRYVSKFSDHFRFSKFDKPGSMEVNLSIYDGLENVIKDKLSLTLNESGDRSKSRPVLRDNISEFGAKNTSRNITAPVIYLSLNRLMSIATRKYSATEIEYLTSEENKDLALTMSNEILGKTYGSIIPTTGAFSSIAMYNSYYNQDSISSGEDNVGQIIEAILSFKRLSEEFKDYAGGILLIDEIDAGLFPAAQDNIITVLRTISSKYRLQIVATTHSPIMLNRVFNEQSAGSTDMKSVYLSDSRGKIEVKENYNWDNIEADLTQRPLRHEKTRNIRIPVFLEDGEAVAFFKAMLYDKLKISKLDIENPKGVGGPNYISLSNSVSYFQHESIVVLDMDTNIPKSRNNFIKLPGQYPPDQLLFDFLNNLAPDDPFWNRDILVKNQVTADVFNNFKVVKDIRRQLKIKQKENLNLAIERFRESTSNKTGAIRELFKDFYNDADIQRYFVPGESKKSAFYEYSKRNRDQVTVLEEQIVKSISYVLKKNFGFSKQEISKYINEIKK